MTSTKVDFEKPLETSGLAGQSALITGGAAGLGLGIALALADAGVYVTIVDLATAAGEQIEQDAQRKGLHIKFATADVTHYPSLLSAFKTAIDFSPAKRLDLVIPSAGVAGSSIVTDAFPPELAPDADLPEPSLKTLDINLNATYTTAILALHYFAKSRVDGKQSVAASGQTLSGEHKAPEPHLLFISSMSGYFDGIPLAPNYTAAKFGVRGMFKTLRSYGPRLGGVRVNMLAPWFIDTAITDHLNASLKQAGMKFGSVDDFVQGAMRVCCDESIVGRSVCVAPKVEGGEAGSGNFDLCDDWEGADGIREFYARLNTKLFYKTEEPVNVAKLWGFE